MIFIDRSIPRGVARALQQVRDDVQALEDVFPPDVPDSTWLEHCGRLQWLVVTRDKSIRRRPAERRAIMEHNVGAFVITRTGNLSRWLLLQILVQHLPEMERLFAETPRPFLFTIDSSGLSRYVLDPVARG